MSCIFSSNDRPLIQLSKAHLENGYGVTGTGGGGALVMWDELLIFISLFIFDVVRLFSPQIELLIFTPLVIAEVAPPYGKDILSPTWGASF